MKKLVCLIIGFLIIIIGGIVYSKSNKPLTKEEYLELTKKIENVKNVKIESDYMVNYIKDGITSTISNDGIQYWSNENTKEYIVYRVDEKKYENLQFSKKNEDNFDNSEYKFMKYEKINGIKCAVVEYKLEDSICKEWIDLKTGIIMKSESTNSDLQTVVIEYKVTYNCVTDKDVEKPDLTGYTKFEENN